MSTDVCGWWCGLSNISGVTAWQWAGRLIIRIRYCGGASYCAGSTIYPWSCQAFPDGQKAVKMSIYLIIIRAKMLWMNVVQLSRLKLLYKRLLERGNPIETDQLMSTFEKRRVLPIHDTSSSVINQVKSVQTLFLPFSPVHQQLMIRNRAIGTRGGTLDFTASQPLKSFFISSSRSSRNPFFKRWS